MPAASFRRWVSVIWSASCPSAIAAPSAASHVPLLVIYRNGRRSAGIDRDKIHKALSDTIRGSMGTAWRQVGEHLGGALSSSAQQPRQVALG